MRDMVEQMLDAPGEDRPDGQWHQHVPTRQAVIPMGLVVRVVRLRHGVPGGGVGEDLPTLAADYWIATPGHTAAAAHLAFSTPLVLLHEAMLDLFDAVARARAGGEAGGGNPVRSPPAYARSLRLS